MKLIKSFTVLLLAVTLFSCQKELSNIGTPDPVPVLPDPISARLQGTVLDETGTPEEGVMVRLGNVTAMTDTRGYFRFQDASLDKKSSVITAEKSGYFKGYRTFAATSGTNQVVIKLIPKILTGTIDATAGGEVSLSNGGKVALPANGTVRASDNSSYTGTINVYAAYIDPTASDISQTVPGSFMGDNKDGERVVLTSYGMMAVVLESSSAEKLQVKSGSMATLTTPIPSSMMSSAPGNIPLWSVDEQTGIWKEEGSATKQGTMYVGEVAHFSFWNCDVPMSTIFLSMTINLSSGDPLEYGLVTIKRASPSQSNYGFTDSLGQINGWIPANELLLLEIYDACGFPFYTQNIGPFNTATNLGTITLPATSSINLFTVTGRLLDCSGIPVSNGYARIYFGYQTQFAATDANGIFLTNFSTCPSQVSTIDIVGIDNTNLLQSGSSNITIVNPLTTVGDIIVCGTSSVQYINYILDGASYSIGNIPSDSLSGYTNGSGGTPAFYTAFTAGQIGTTTRINFSFTHNSEVPGTYPLYEMAVNNFIRVTPDQGTVVTITNFPTSPGEFYEGTFTGTYNSGVNVISGSFRIRR